VIPLADIAAATGVELRPAGPGRLRGLCPFHRERTPSFFVFEDRNRWRCFGCGEGGDTIDFVRRSRGCGYREALKILGIDSPAATAATMRKIEHQRRERAAAEWRERDVAWTIGTTIRRCHQIMRRITPDTLDSYALILTYLPQLEYEHDIMIHGNPSARTEVVRAYSKILLFPRGLLWRRDFDYRAWLRGVLGEPRDGNGSATARTWAEKQRYHQSA
jgi:hypothetical protein